MICHENRILTQIAAHRNLAERDMTSIWWMKEVGVSRIRAGTIPAPADKAGGAGTCFQKMNFIPIWISRLAAALNVLPILELVKERLGASKLV